MRTTVRLPPDLLKAARRHASETGRTLTALIEDAIRLAISAEENSAGRVREPLPTYGRGGLREGVDLDDGAALLDLMDEGD